MFSPKYTITHQILNDLMVSAEIKSVVLRTPILPRQEIKLRRNALIRMIHSSTSIEGNILSRYEVEKVLAGKKQIKIVDFMMTMGMVDSNDIVDILNIDKRTAQRYINEILKTKLIRKERKGPASFYVLNI